MANVIKTVLTYQLDGNTRDFTIPFEYLARKFIVVTLVGRDRKVLTLNVDYRFATRTTLSTTKAWGSSDGYDTIELRRVTSATERLVDFTDGSILRAYDLNVAQVQTLHVAEEARDLSADTIGVNKDGQLDARGRRIVNVADAVDHRDAIPLGQLLSQSNNAWQARNDAEKFRNETQKFRNDAEQFKRSAESSRDDAASFKTQASQSADRADSAKSSATASASSATESARAASSAAETATTQASASSASARDAKTQAELAKQAADKIGDIDEATKKYRDEAEGFSNAAEQAKNVAEGFHSEMESFKDHASESAASAESAKSAASTSASSAADSAGSAKSSAETATAQASAASASARDAKTQADIAKEAAEKLGNFSELAGAIENVDGKNISWKGAHSFGGDITIRAPGDSVGDITIKNHGDTQGGGGGALEVSDEDGTMVTAKRSTSGHVVLDVDGSVSTKSSTVGLDCGAVINNGQNPAIVRGTVGGGQWAAWSSRAAGIHVGSSGGDAHSVWKAVGNGNSPLAAMQVGINSGSTVARLQVGQGAQFDFNENGECSLGNVKAKTLTADSVKSPILDSLSELRIGRKAVWSGSLAPNSKATASQPIYDRLIELVVSEGSNNYATIVTLPDNAEVIVAVGVLRYALKLEGDNILHYVRGFKETGVPGSNDSRITEIRVLKISV